MNFSIYMKDRALNLLFGLTTSWALAISVGLSRGDPLPGASGLDEPSGHGYERFAIGSANWDLGSPYWTIGNNCLVTFPEATGDWGLVTYYALFDEDHDGMMLAYGQLKNAIHIDTGYEVWFGVGELSITLD